MVLKWCCNRFESRPINSSWRGRILCYTSIWQPHKGRVFKGLVVRWGFVYKINGTTIWGEISWWIPSSILYRLSEIFHYKIQAEILTLLCKERTKQGLQHPQVAKHKIYYETDKRIEQIICYHIKENKKR